MPNSYKIQNIKSGFTLVEMLMAMVVFSMSLIVLLNVSSSTLSNISSTRQKVSAQYLAEEGIEYVRYVRDSLYIQHYPDLQLIYDNFETIGNACAAGCDFNVLANNGTVVSNPATFMTYNVDSGYTGRNQTITTDSRYQRTITINMSNSNNSAEVTSAVSWLDTAKRNQTVTLSTILFFNLP